MKGAAATARGEVARSRLDNPSRITRVGRPFSKEMLLRLILSTVLLISLCAGAAAQGLVRKTAESPAAFSLRVLNLTDDSDAHVTAADWNGRSTLFVDYVNGSERDVVALEKAADDSYRKIDVTTGEEEGGTASVAAIGFARSNHDKSQKLIVLLSWPVQHADVSGTLYEVRIFDAVRPGHSKLTYLADVSHRFDADSCDCDRSDGKPTHYRFKTIAAIKQELLKTGF
jgi:hypothetical protein